MATKDDVLAWGEAAGLFEKGRYQEAISIFQTVSQALGSKIHFNIGMCFCALKKNPEAIEAFTTAVRADKYFAAAYFQRGYCQVQLGAFGKSVQDYSFAYEHLRGNDLIDYSQLGMPYQLHSCEVLYNRALCKSKLNDSTASQDVTYADSIKVGREHDRIEDAAKTGKYAAPYFIPNKIYTPPEQKLKNAGKVDYLGHSKIVAAVDEADNIIGFKDAHLRKMEKERDSPSPPPPNQSRPNAPPSRQVQQSAPAPAPAPSPAPAPALGNNRQAGSNSNLLQKNNNSSPPLPVGGKPPLPGGGSTLMQKNNAPAAAPAGFQSSQLPPGSKIKVKCHFKDTRIVLIEEGIRFDDFSKRVQEKFDGVGFAKIKYRDEDQEMITLTDQDDLLMALTTPDALSGKMEIWCS